MLDEALIVRARPRLKEPRMVLAFSGWMDGGEVSTGTVEYLVEKLEAEELAEIGGDDFYIYHFPGSMELSAMLRPHTRIANGLLEEYEEPGNKFFYQEESNVILFSGREPNVHWQRYAECVLGVAQTFGVSGMFFIGSVAGVVPHTREPRFLVSASSAQLRETLEQYRMRPSNYEGPASIATHLTRLAAQRGIGMASVVAEIPAYVQGRNVRCIEAAARRMAAILGLTISFDDMRAVSDELERRLNELVAKRKDLAELIGKLEQDYDNEVFDTQMGDLKDWLQQRGLRLD
jgi:proteasome assembly chaperone (PAC2) family protein